VRIKEYVKVQILQMIYNLKDSLFLDLDFFVYVPINLHLWRSYALLSNEINTYAYIHNSIKKSIDSLGLMSSVASIRPLFVCCRMISDLDPFRLVLFFSIVTALTTWLGALPFAFAPHMSKKRFSAANALAAWLMLAASFWLVYEWVSFWDWEVIGWMLLGLVAILTAKRLLWNNSENVHIWWFHGKSAVKMLLIVWVMTVHSFSEWIAIGVWFWPSVELWLLISIALALHNIPEWLAISVILVPRGVSWRKAWLRSIFTSLPQPLMALPAFLFVQHFQPLLPYGLGFAAGAMIRMSVSELLPDAFKHSSKENVATVTTIAIAAMVLFQSLLG